MRTVAAWLLGVVVVATVAQVALTGGFRLELTGPLLVLDGLCVLVLLATWAPVRDRVAPRRGPIGASLLKLRAERVARDAHDLFSDHQAGASAASVMARYDSQLSAEALALYDEFARRGLVGIIDRIEFEYPSNPLGVRRVAQHLGSWARRL